MNFFSLLSVFLMRTVLVLAVTVISACVSAVHEDQELATFETGVTEAPTPWTHLNFNNDPDDFQVAIVSDRTGGPRAGIWEDAMMKLNWLQPEFVITVGDMIRGTAKDAAGNAADWDQMLNWISVLEMPYFFIAGNHDIQAKVVPGRVLPDEMRHQWEERFGTPYYWFKYRDVLFITLFSNDGQDQILSQEQVDYFKQVLEQHQDVRWTMVFLHHPLWAYTHETRFGQVEKMLKGRPYTVFAGHTHNYAHFERRKMNYYVLASTGGGSPLLGNAFGSFDHVTWVTMKDEGPVIANLRLDGILPHDVTPVENAFLGEDLYRSNVLETQVYLAGEEMVTGGIALLSLKNRTELPIRFRGRFFHNHNISPKPGSLDILIPPGERASAEIELDITEMFPRSDELFLELDATLAIDGPDYVGLALPGVHKVPVTESDFQATALETAVFVDSMDLGFVEPPAGTLIRYTTDGSDPTASSAVYVGPVPISESATVKARLFTESGYTSRIDSVELRKIEAGQGQLLCHYFENDPEIDRWKKLPDLHEYTPTLTRTVTSFSLDELARRDEHFGALFHGKLNVPEDGEYTFTVVSDDGAEIRIDEQVIVSDRMKHPPREATGEPIAMKAGSYAFELHHFQDKRTRALELYYSVDGGPRLAVPFDWFSFD